MLFNSIDFAIFLPIVFFIYWFGTFNSLMFQNFLILIASYLFYGWWDFRFLSLIMFSTVIDYSIGLLIFRENNRRNRKILLGISMFINLGFLAYFKYFNFFAESFVEAFTLFGMHIDSFTLDIILPVGISFYTFQTMSYTIDIYRGHLKPTKDFIVFSAFVSFFPQLVAGPIERATHLLPQFYKKRVFNYSRAVDGMRQILWGLFKKVVIADNCAKYANEIFNNSADMNASSLLFGALFFTFQIYGDFSGYSDVAIGTSRLFGFDLMQNFAFPYFSRDIAEFWRRWHISLSTWFRDYLYIPLGGSKGGVSMKIRNTFTIFLVSGFWHGANWTFIFWGGLNALYFLPLLIASKNRKNLGRVAFSKKEKIISDLINIVKTFILTVFAWIFFRAESLKHAFNYILGLLDSSIIHVPNFNGRNESIKVLLLIVVFMLIEWLGRDSKFALEYLGLKWKQYLRWGFYLIIFLAIIMLSGNEQQFIYFQF